MRTAFTLLVILSLSATLSPMPHAPSPQPTLGTRPAYVVFDRNLGPVKIYAAVEDCISFCGNANRRATAAGRVGLYSDQQVDIFYHMPEEGWQPTQRDILEDYNHPQGLADKFLEQKTVYLVMQQHFNLGLRIYADSAACYRYAGSFKRDNGQPAIRKVSYFYRVKKSYDEIWRIREKQLRSIRPQLPHEFPPALGENKKMPWYLPQGIFFVSLLYMVS